MSDRERDLAIAFATTALAADAAFGIFSVVGEPFGSINDFGNGVAGLLAAGFVVSATDEGDRGVRSLAWAGAVVSVAGSALVITHTSGWLLAGFVSGLGFGLIGPGIVRASDRLAQRGEISPRLATAGRLIGWLMATGVTAVVPAALRLDDAATAPAWSWLTFLGVAVGLLPLPLWAIAVARARRTSRALSAP